MTYKKPSQQILQELSGRTGTFQEIVNLECGFSANQYSSQEALNLAAGRASNALTLEECFYANVSANMSLGDATTYTMQDILIAAQDGGLTIAQVITGSFNPLTAFSWDAAYWASDPDWSSNPGDGGTLTTWRDGSGNNNTLTTGAGTPIYRASLAGLNDKPTVELDGSSDMNTAAFGDATQPVSYVVVTFINTSGATRTIIDSKTVFDVCRLSVTSGEVLQLAAGSLVTTQAVTENAAHLITAHFNGASSTTTLDGAVSSAVNPGTQATNSGIQFGQAYNGAQNYPGKVSFLGIYSGDITSQTNWAAFKTWVDTFYGITVS